MNYQALLFCPDEKTARVVTQVLTELEFSVELSNEPFATVKKLMARQYDAVVVDCDNEQNAALLFKSARNSTSNQTSLAVAVVEGQAGVAKAFRIGANLVLTKPVNVEQSKGTLRVARGLLKKAEAGKILVGKSTSGQSSPGQSTPGQSSSGQSTSGQSSSGQSSFGKSSATSLSAGSNPGPNRSYPGGISLSAAKAGPSTPAAKFAATMSSNPPVLAGDPSTTSFEIEQDPTPALEATETAFLQSIPQPAASRASGIAASKESPWLQLSRPAAANSETAKAIDLEGGLNAGATESAVPTAAPTRVRHPFNTGLSSAQGAAAAPAREVVSPEPAKEFGNPLSSDFKSSNLSDKALEQLAAIDAPAFSANADAPNRSRKSLVAALIVIAIAAAGYFEREKVMAVLEPAPAATAPAPPRIVPPASAPIEAAPAQPSGSQAQSTDHLPQLNPGQSSSSHPDDSASNGKPSPDEIVVVENSSPEPASGVKLLPVKKSPAHTEKPALAEVQQTVAPPSLHAQSESQDQTVAHLITAAPIAVPHRAPELLRVSQGITQGMLVKKVKPIYPPAALQQHRQGTVEIVANIAKNGSISSAKILKGDPLLAQAALTAVRQWKYKPYTLDGQAVDVQTQISVNFTLP